jgi:hypothetical protein
MEPNTITIIPSNTTVTPITSTQSKPNSNLTLCQTKQQYEINKCHQVFGHVNAKYLQSTASYYGWQLTRNYKPCVHCALANITQSPISKSNIPSSTIPGHKIFLDISKFAYPSTVGSKFWLIILDDATDFVWSIFLKCKS